MSTSSKIHTIILLDDHEMVRQGIELGLSKEVDLEVVGSFGTGRELLEALAQRPVDVVVMDFVLGPSDIDGLSLIQTLNRRFSKCKCIVVSSHYTPATVALAFKRMGNDSSTLDFILATLNTGWTPCSPGNIQGCR